MGLHMLLYHVYRAVFCGIRETTKSAYARMAIIWLLDLSENMGSVGSLYLYNQGKQESWIFIVM